MNSKLQKRSYRWNELEEQHDKPMREILLEAYTLKGTFNGMATLLGVDFWTVKSYWLRCDLPDFGRQDDGTVTIPISGEIS